MVNGVSYVRMKVSNMIYERLDFGILSADIEKLQAHLTAHVIPLDPVMVGPYFGGWSVWSSDGDYKDGFQRGQLMYEPSFMPGLTITEKATALGIKPREMYRVPTKICFGYLSELVEQIRAIGLEPARVRLSVLKAGGHSTNHRDAPLGRYSIRLHIPIFTNPKAVFVCEGEEVHMPANGSAYIVDVSREHQVFNRGSTDRIILLADIVDRPWITNFHRRPLPLPSK
jgi:hypothetical protein